LPARLSRWHERWIYVVGVLILVTGLGWLADHYLFAGSAEFGEAHAESEPLWLRLHGAAAMIGLVVFGSLFPGHVVRAWRSWTNWRSGFFMFGLTTLLVATGYGLYYVGDEQTRPWISVIHWLVGLVAAASLVVHARLGKRQSRHLRLTASKAAVGGRGLAVAKAAQTNKGA
jgi:hypothetical protein